LNHYVASMRQKIGNDTLLLVGCGAIIEDREGRILLQKRRNGGWGVPGGFIELGETFMEAVKREVLEETGLRLGETELFGVYSGEPCFGEYPNGDKIFSLQVIFYSNHYTGELKKEDQEWEDIRFFGRHEMPEEINLHHIRHLEDWVHRRKRPVID